MQSRTNQSMNFLLELLQTRCSCTGLPEVIIYSVLSCYISYHLKRNRIKPTKYRIQIQRMRGQSWWHYLTTMKKINQKVQRNCKPHLKPHHSEIVSVNIFMIYMCVCVCIYIYIYKVRKNKQFFINEILWKNWNKFLVNPIYTILL